MPFKSAFRHVYGEASKPEKSFLDIKKPYTSGESSYVAANAKYVAFAQSGGGGPVVVQPMSKTGRPGGDWSYTQVNCNKGKALDIQFHPFVENIIGIASEDMTISVAEFKDGMTEKCSQAAVTLKGHTKKCSHLKWSPSANNVVASLAWDRTCKLWNVSTGDCVQTYDDLSGTPFSLDWASDSSLLAVSTKEDKLIQLYDPRTNESVQKIVDAMEGTKSSKVFFMSKLGLLGCTGYTKNAKRQLKIWDMKNLEKPLYSQVIDQQSSVMMPHYDADLNLLYLYGKGDGSVQYYEITKTDKVVYNLGAYRNPEPQKGGAFVPKRGLDTGKCEIARFMKLTKNSIIPISFIVPRKAGGDVFQADIFPDSASGLPGMSSDEYLGGQNAVCPTSSMDPEKGGDAAPAMVFEKKKPYGELVEENEALKKRIAELEAQLESVASS